LIGFKAKGDKTPCSHHPRRENAESNQQQRGIDVKAVSISRWSIGLAGGKLVMMISALKLSVWIG
jgi:hypothetical protein